MDIDRSAITAATTLGELTSSWVDHTPVGPLADDLTVETTPAGPGWSVNNPREIADATRARQAPYIALGVTAATGYGLCGIDTLAAAVGNNIHSVVLTGTLAGTALAVPVLRSVFRDRIPDEWVRRWWLATTAAAGWVDLTVAHGPSWPMLGVLVVGTAAVSARWAAEHELPNPGDVPAPAPPPALIAPPRPPAPKVDRSRAAQIETAWRSRVATGRNPTAAGSKLTGRQELPNASRWTAELDPDGTVGCTDLISAPVRIARSLQVNPNHIIIERLEGVHDREDLASVTIVTKDLLAGGVPYRGPRYRDGRVPFAMRADGDGEAEWVAYDGTGVRGGLITGGQGSGKSSLMGALGMAFRSSGDWRVLFGDGDEQGNSSHLLKSVAHDFAAGPAEVLQQLEALEAWYAYRGLILADLTRGPDGAPRPITDPATQKPVEWIKPCVAYPGYVWFLDELYRLAKNTKLQDANFIGRAAKLLRIMRKIGGTIIVGTQSLLAEDFGGDSAFRGMLAQGNLIAMRTENKAEQHVVGDFGIAPSTLPKGGGYAFANDGAGNAMVRVAWSEDMDQYAADLPKLGIGDRSARVYDHYRAVKVLDPVVEAERRKRERARWDQALDSGAPLPNAADEAVAAAPAGQATTVGGVGVPQPPARKLSAVPDVAKPVPVKVAPLSALGPLTTKATLVLATLRSRPGPWRSRNLVETTDLSGSDVSKALAVLVACGLAHRPGDVQGVHEATPVAQKHEETA